MSLEGNYSFGGIGAAEAKDRENEHRTGVPSQTGRYAPLLAVALKYLTGVRVTNQGSATADVRLGHGGSTKTQTTELMTSFMVSTTVYRGRVQFDGIVPGTVVVAAAAGPGALTDADGDGILYDAGLVARGTIVYATGVVDITFAGAVTELVTITYQHTDWTQFSMAQVQTFTAAGAYPEAFALQFGRVVPGTVTLTNGALVFADDGKGNMVQTNTAPAVQGSIDYGTGLVTLTGGSATLATTGGGTSIAYSFNPFAAVVVAGGGQLKAPLLPGALPEFDNEAWADGVKGESEVVLLGQTTDQSGTTNLVTYWAHHVGDDEGFRVREIFSGFPAGGQSNDPRVSS